MGWTLITGAAGGLGASIAEELAKTGRDVLVHWRSSGDSAEQVVDLCRSYGVKAEMVQGDFSTPESTERFILEVKGRFTEVENIVHNVGNLLMKSSLNTPTDEWLELFQANLHAPFQITKALLESVIRLRGNIITVGLSGLGKCAGNVRHTAYTLTKHNLWILTKSMAKELAEKGVRVNMVSPGQLENSVILPEDPSSLPMGRPGKCAEVSRVVSFLLEPENEYITGQNIEVAGAYLL